MIDQEFIDQYSLLLIKQYWEKPKAKAEIELLASFWSELFTFIDSWDDAFDLDLAEGDRLDKIGSLVGIKRTADGPAFNDEDYRFFIRLKIANNVVVGTMINEERLSLQDVIQFAFGGIAYVKDNYDMTLSLFIGYGIPDETIERVIRLGLLPKPAAVRYKDILSIFDAALNIRTSAGPGSMLMLSGGSALRIKSTKNFVS